jgi:protein-S-isoprenylcysteine O-methyltransferase Ste14
VRHPQYLGFLLAFWGVMTQGHSLFALATTGYLLIGIQLGSRPDRRLRGALRRYRTHTPMLLPFTKR